MSYLLIILVIGAFSACFFLRRGNEREIKLMELPVVFEKVKAADRDATFAAFCFRINDESVSDKAVNVQFSVDGGRIGFDWILICEVNKRDRDRFLALAQRRGHQATEHRAQNGCEYLRVENGDLVGLCEASICELYGLPESATVGMVWEGCDWP
jgi:hypothetical protein